MNLFVRTKASPAIGVGHFMRCFAIAEEAQAQGMDVTFLMEQLATPLRDRLHAIGVPLLPMRHALGSAADGEAVAAMVGGSDWLIVDSYHATADYLAGLHAHTRLLVMDDMAEVEPLSCRIVVNAALSAAGLPYGAIAPQAVKLLGPVYAPIRREFRARPHSNTGWTTLSVMFGGSDPFDMTGRTVAALRAALPIAEIRVIVGPANTRRRELQGLERTLEGVKVFVDPPVLADVLAGSDLVVTAAGGSVNEIAALGLAAMAIVVADNQAIWLEACPFPVVDAREGLPDDFAPRAAALASDRHGRNAVAAAAHRMVDGRGAERIVEAMRSWR